MGVPREVILTWAALVLCAGVHADPVVIPTELDAFSANGIGAEFRNPVTARIRDMVKNYRTIESAPGVVAFANADGGVIATIRANQTSWRIDDSSGRMLYQEESSSDGKKETKPITSSRVFLDGDADFDLHEGETRRSTRFSSENDVLFQIDVNVLKKPAGDQIKSTILTLGKTRVLFITELTNADGSKKIRELHLDGSSFELTWRGSTISSSFAEATFRVTANHPQGFLVDQLEFTRNGSVLSSLVEMMDSVNDRIYSRLVTNTSKRMIQTIVNNGFPAVQAVAEIGVSNRFSNDLIVISQQLDQATTNPAIIPSIKRKVTEFINAIQTGTLKVTDSRP